MRAINRGWSHIDTGRQAGGNSTSFSRTHPRLVTDTETHEYILSVFFIYGPAGQTVAIHSLQSFPPESLITSAQPIHCPFDFDSLPVRLPSTHYPVHTCYKQRSFQPIQ